MISIGVYIPVLELGEKWSTEALGMAATAMLLATSLSGIISGVFSDHFNPRYAIIGGALLASMGAWLAGSAPEIGTFIAAAAMIGTGTGLATMVPSILIISHIFGPHRGLGLGAYFATLAMSAGILPTIVSTLIENTGWRSTLHITSATIAVSSMLMVLARIPKLSDRTLPDCKSDISPATGDRVSSAVCTLSFWAIALAMTLSLISVQGVLFSAVAYFVDSGMSSLKAVNVYGAANLIGMPALFAIGALVDRVGARRVLPIGLVVQGIGTFALLIAITGGFTGWVAIAVFALFWGASSGLPSQVGPMLLEDTFGSLHFGALLGTNTAISGILSAFAPLLTALIRDVGGSYATVFIICSLMALISAPLIWLVRPKISFNF